MFFFLLSFDQIVRRPFSILPVNVAGGETVKKVICDRRRLPFRRVGPSAAGPVEKYKSTFNCRQLKIIFAPPTMLYTKLCASNKQL